MHRIEPLALEPRPRGGCFARRRIAALGSAALLVFACYCSSFSFAAEWNQWLGGPGRSLSVTNPSTGDRVPVLTPRWRRPLGSGVAGISIWGTNAITGMTDGKQDLAVLLDANTGVERWRVPLGRTRKRSEGTPLGPLSTPAIDGDAAYVQALDGGFFCVDIASGKVRWETSVKRAFKAFEPGYGFASSPLLVDNLVILLPAGSTSASVTALDRRTGEVRWQTPLGTATEYSSATLAPQSNRSQIVVQLGSRMAGLDPVDGRPGWQIDDVAGGLWTPLVLANGRVFFPLAQETQLLELGTGTPRKIWASPVFESVMGPVVEINGLLVGHHKRRLTGVDAGTGERLWQVPDETDGQLLVLGSWLLFVNDRAGRLEVLEVDRTKAAVRHRQTVMKSTRMETPLAFASDTLYLRATEELIALKVE